MGSQRVGHDWPTSLHYNRNSTQWRVQRSNLYFSLDAANTTADYRRSINSSNCHISFSSKETDFWTMCPTRRLRASDKSQVRECSLKPTMSQSKEKESHIFQIFHIKHHIASMYLVSFDSNHNSSSQIFYILRINLIIICCVCFLQCL